MYVSVLTKNNWIGIVQEYVERERDKRKRRKEGEKGRVTSEKENSGLDLHESE